MFFTVLWGFISLLFLPTFLYGFGWSNLCLSFSFHSLWNILKSEFLFRNSIDSPHLEYCNIFSLFIMMLSSSAQETVLGEGRVWWERLYKDLSQRLAPPGTPWHKSDTWNSSRLSALMSHRHQGSQYCIPGHHVDLLLPFSPHRLDLISGFDPFSSGVSHSSLDWSPCLHACFSSIIHRAAKLIFGKHTSKTIVPCHLQCQVQTLSKAYKSSPISVSAMSHPSIWPPKKIPSSATCNHPSVSPVLTYFIYLDAHCLSASGIVLPKQIKWLVLICISVTFEPSSKIVANVSLQPSKLSFIYLEVRKSCEN